MAEDLLVNLGIKVTKQRKTIIKILENTNTPLTADDIYERVEDKDTINYSTVYRTLSLLDEKGAVTKIGEPGGKTYYQLKRHYHEHKIECVECHECITINQCPLDAFSCMLNKETGFIITEHHLQIKGICPKCAQKHK